MSDNEKENEYFHDDGGLFERFLPACLAREQSRFPSMKNSDRAASTWNDKSTTDNVWVSIQKWIRVDLKSYEHYFRKGHRLSLL
jgi:hypothetical protein